VTDQDDEDLEVLRQALLARIDGATSAEEISAGVREVLDLDRVGVLDRWVEMVSTLGQLTLGAEAPVAAGHGGTASLELRAAVSAAGEVQLAGEVPRPTAEFTLKVSDTKQPVLTINQGIAFAILVATLQPYVAGLHGDSVALARSHAIAVAVAMLILLGQRPGGRS
jgi:hypothetical protein